jgi:CheY-like chemotaxis protein
MNPKNVSVLFMDDEISDGTAIMVSDAAEALKSQGYDVDSVDTMSAAIDAFYHKFYKVFVLDIDMSKVDDLLSRNQRRGSHVAEIYRGLDNHCAVIMYSARGTVEDWFRVGNRHIFGYVHKNSSHSVEELVQMVGRAVTTTAFQIELPTPRSGDVLVARTGSPALSASALVQLVEKAGAFTAITCTMAEMPERLAQGDFAAGLLVADQFSTRPLVLETIDRICAIQPRPQIVIGCEGREESEESLLHLVNARPFRLVNLLAADAGQVLGEAVHTAAAWYGGNECFPVESEYIHRAAADIDWQELDQHLGVRDAEDAVLADEDSVSSAEEDNNNDA